MSNDTREHWNFRYSEGGNSGYGSYGEQAALKLSILKKNISNIESITDIGCGDFAFSERVCNLFPKAKYQGFDISDVIVKTNKQLFPAYSFNTPPEEYPAADLVLCIDVLFHMITEKDYTKLLKEIEKPWVKYLAVTAVDSKNDVSGFGKPIVKELIEAKDAYLYIWKK